MPYSTEMPIPAVYLARQPIFDGQMKLCAYELLFRSGEQNQANFVDGEKATAEVLTSAIIDIGLEDIVGDRPAFINMTYDFLTGGLLTPNLNSKIVLEVLEDVIPDANLIEKLTELVANGYTLALDDFVFKPEFEPLLHLADIVKLDVMAFDKSALEEQVEALQPYKVKLLAEKVESKDEYEFCKAIGFELFQGYFFCKPEIVEGKRPSASRVLMLNLMSKLQNPDIKLEDLDTLIAQDAALAYKLLKHINSAFFGVDKDISSIKHAISMAGLDTIKRWTTLTLMSKLGEQKTPELVVIALVRANMCQILGREDKTRDSEKYFTVGLFSVLDALMDIPKEEILDSLPLEAEIKDAIRDYSNPLGTVLRLVIHYEKDIDTTMKEDPSQMAHAYYEAIKRAELLRGALS